MLWKRIAQRVPSARPVGTATLHGHVLHWHKAGRDGSGKCDIVPTASPGCLVHGVLYELARDEKYLLDAAEGLGQGYDEEEVSVETAFGPALAWTYRATATDPRLLPFTWYRALVVAGAREHGLPADYIQALAAVRAREDSDAARASLHWALADATS